MKSYKGLHGLMLTRIEAACQVLKCPDDFETMLSNPVNELSVNFPVKMDNNELRVFSGFRVQHNNLLGPFLGGLRFHPSLNVDDIKGLAIWRTLQNALLDLPMGGSMGGITFNTQDHSIKELEHITRRFIYSLGSNIGPDYDVMCPDVNTNSQIMAWVVDTFLSTITPTRRNDCTHIACGKPLRLNGISGHSAASGKGLALILSAWAKDNGLSLSGGTYILQGFGKVGQACALELEKKGMILLAVEDSSGPIYNAKGISPSSLVEYASLHRKIHSYPEAVSIDHQQFFSLNADVFIPSALQNQITLETAPVLNVKLVVEGASQPSDQAGDILLAQKGIPILPGILCNAGGAVASYLEWLQNKRSENWEEEELNQNISRYLLDAYERTTKTAAELKTDLRSAANVAAVERLHKVASGRGLFP